MGIYIKGMEMPSSCSVCDYFEYEGGDYQPWVVCRLTEEKLEDPNSRGDECPLTEVKEPHGELIDKDKVIDAIFRKLSVKSKENILPSEKTIFSKVVKAETVIERSEDDEK